LLGDLEELDENEDDDETLVTAVISSETSPEISNLIVNHDFEQNDYLEYVPPENAILPRYPENRISIEHFDSI
jgi:hypothetical protein